MEKERRLSTTSFNPMMTAALPQSAASFLI
jgi:hypothetical protein